MFLIILIISYSVIINGFTSAKCYEESYDIEKVPSETSLLPSPAHLELNRTDSEINLFISDQREDFDLVLFANPFIEVRPENGCPPLNISDYNLRRHYIDCHLSTHEKLNNVIFSKIFTGCHYFVMISQNRRWDFGDFYKTSYQYLNTRVTLKDHWNTKPESLYSSLQIELTFEIPLDCISVSVDFYERPYNAGNDLREIQKDEIRKDQLCTIRIGGQNNSVECTLEEKIRATVSTKAYKEKNKWIAHLTWANLTRGGGHYYISYSNIEREKCEETYGLDDMVCWELIKEQIYVDLGKLYASDIPKTPSRGFPWLWITCGLIGFICIVIVVYWIWMWRRLPGAFCRKNESYGIPVLLKGPTRLICENEPTDILLIYERGSPSVKELETFKLTLRQKCRGYKIRDVYASSEWTNLEKINSVERWVEQQVEAESIVIWFDTPQLRFRLNDQKKYRTGDDFRDMASTCAFSWVKAQFLNPTTQYRRHFVVRMKEFEVDDRQDDPLHMVSPYARYLLSDDEQFADLCNHLNSLTDLKIDDFRRELKSDSQSNSGTCSGVSQPNIGEL